MTPQERAGFCDRILEACGGGRTLHIGPESAAMAAPMRARGVEAHAIALTQLRFVGPLPFETGSFDLVHISGLLHLLTGGELANRVVEEALRVSRRHLLIEEQGPRDGWERAILQHHCRKHPLHQLLVPYEGLDWLQGPSPILFEKLPDNVTLGRSLADLAPARDLHMDMLREGGRRADAHVARYMFARRFIRPGDRVLDAACGLGYGSALLADGTLAESVTGLDIDEKAIAYARDHYCFGRTRVAFDVSDVAALDDLPAASFDAVVSFETLEHVDDPDAFLVACRRLLTPAGRLICSVPNEWLNEHGVDPNPHHLHVFNRDTLEQTIRPHFLIEHVYGQTAGGGMKLGDAGRAMWPADGSTDDAEWWLLVGMTDPMADARPPFRAGDLAATPDDRTNVLAFERDYDNAWLVKAMVTIGLRTESPGLIDRLSARTLRDAPISSADEGAALCVSLYRAIAESATVDATRLRRIARYCNSPAATPHARRWQISLRYAEALYRLGTGDRAGAIKALDKCARADAVLFSPLLATKTVGACFLRGWIALQSRDLDTARRFWTQGVVSAERAVRTPWSDFLLDRERPALFGLREAAVIVDLASQCAAGLHLLPHATERPGVVASQIMESLQGRIDRAHRRTATLEAELRQREHEVIALSQALASAQAALATREEEIRSRETDLLQVAGTVHASLLLKSPGVRVPPSTRIAIFGTGEGGKRAQRDLTNRGATIRCFADNDASRQGQTIDGIPVVDPQRLRDIGVDIIAVASLPGRYEIFEQLESMGYRAGKDFDGA